jgi:tetratricopeptide (TPR) repeat protein
LPEGERLARRRLAILEVSGRDGTLAYASAMHSLGLMLHGQGRFAECVEYYQRLVRLYDSLSNPPPLGLATACLDVALNLDSIGRPDEALPYALRGMQIHERDIAPLAGDRFLARPNAIMAAVLIGVERYEEAEAAARRSMELHDRLRGPDHVYPRFERRILIWALAHVGKFEEAAPLIEHFDRLSRERGIAPSLDDLSRDAFIARRTGGHERALAMWQFAEKQAFEGPAPQFSRGDPAVAFGVGELVGVLTDLRRPREGLAKGVPVYDAVRATLREAGQDVPTNRTLRRLASELLRAHEAAGDASALAAARALRERYSDLHPAPGFTPAPSTR